MSLLKSVNDAVAAMPWLEESDQAAVKLALAYAMQMDEVLSTSTDNKEITSALYLGPHLLNTLRALGGTPAERQALGPVEEVGGKLASLRAIHAS